VHLLPILGIKAMADGQRILIRNGKIDRLMEITLDCL